MKRAEKIVVDSSVIVKWLNRDNENYLEQADKILKNCQADKIALYAPELAKYEVGNAILNKKMELPQTKSSLATLYSLPISFIKLDEESALDTYDFSDTLKITYYDGVFLTLAKKIKAILITDNPKHQQTVKGIKILPLKDY
jgi:predicted nucleic acid-binding protein